MKIMFIHILLCFALTRVSAQSLTYTASTPAGPVVKNFLGIALKDSVDFIRWRLVLEDNNYHLTCNYGISKPNTNGFINGGKAIALKGVLKKDGLYYMFYNGNKKLGAAVLNTNLLQLTGINGRLLSGNGGWSYTLNNILPQKNAPVRSSAPHTVLKDSMAFEGRTPCQVPGIVEPGSLCYKLKWYLVLYAEKGLPGTYSAEGTRWRQKGPRKGSWQVIKKDGHILYLLNDEHGKPLIFLLKADDQVLLFTDAEGNPLTGDADFSFTLNRVF